MINGCYTVLVYFSKPGGWHARYPLYRIKALPALCEIFYNSGIKVHNDITDLGPFHMDNPIRPASQFFRWTGLDGPCIPMDRRV